MDKKLKKYIDRYDLIENYTSYELVPDGGMIVLINQDTNLFYILSNHSTLDTEEVLEKMPFVNEIFTLVSIESKDVSMVLGLYADASNSHKDYENSMQYVCALRAEANLIVTNDKGFVSLDIALIEIKD